MKFNSIVEVKGSDGSTINKIMDFSHKINKLQVGKSISRLKRLSKKFPDIINPTSLKGESFQAKNKDEGHSRFLYELNIVTAKIGR